MGRDIRAKAAPLCFGYWLMCVVYFFYETHFLSTQMLKGVK